MQISPEMVEMVTSLKATLTKERETRASQARLGSYRPYPKQQEFHDAGATHRERLFLAGNRCGKTMAGGFETAMHLSGLYPEWWKGKRFEKPTRVWAAGVTGESTRDVVQAKLFGSPDRREDWGTGAIPKRLIGDVMTGRGIGNAIDMASIKHVSGGWSSLSFKSFEKGREKWQGAALEVVFMDEEPPSDIYYEALTRTNETQGVIFITCTPLLGMSDVMQMFLMGDKEASDRVVIQAGIEDAGHFTVEDRERIIRSYPAFERDARTRGIPQLGSGRVFPVNQDDITCESFQIPDHWPQIVGLDFGWDHPSAAARLAWDRDNDVIYVTATHRAREQTPVLFAASVKPWGAWLPVAWPLDGLQHDKGSGEQLAAQYRAQGLNMLKVRATFEDGTNGLEAGVQDMLAIMQTGRLQVFSHLHEFFAEFNLYHRKDGLIVKLNEDILSAVRYGIMMKRFATVQTRKIAPKLRESVSGAMRSDGYGWMGE